MVQPSRPGYGVKGAFNPGAVEHNGEIVLLLRVAEDCIPKDGYTSVPYYSFENGIGTPEILEKSLNDPDVKLKDTRGVVYKGQDYLPPSAISALPGAEMESILQSKKNRLSIPAIPVNALVLRMQE